MKLKFEKGITKIHIPFFPRIRLNGDSPFDELYSEIAKHIPPKGATGVRAVFEVYIDYKKSFLSNEIAEIIFEK